MPYPPPAPGAAVRPPVVTQDVGKPVRQIVAVALNGLCAITAKLFPQDTELIGHALVLQGDVLGISEEILLVEERLDIAHPVFDKLIRILFEVAGIGRGLGVGYCGVAGGDFMVGRKATPEVESYATRPPVI